MEGTAHAGLIKHWIQNVLVKNLENKKVVSAIVVCTITSREDTLKEAADFLRNEIKQYKIMLGGVIRDDYRKYLERKTLYFQALLDVILPIKGEFQGETKEGEK